MGWALCGDARRRSSTSTKLASRTCESVSSPTTSKTTTTFAGHEEQEADPCARRYREIVGYSRLSRRGPSGHGLLHEGHDVAARSRANQQCTLSRLRSWT